VNSAGCGGLSGIPVRGTWYRAVDPRFLATALSTIHTPTTPSRFSPGRPAAPAFEVLYLAENPMVAMFEARALFGSPSTPGGVVPHPSRPLVTLPIVVALTAVADLTDPAESAIVDTNAQELTGDWRSYATRIPPTVPPAPHSGVPPTHSLGISLYSLGKYRGLVTFSATLPDYKILVVFPDRLMKRASDYLQYSFHDDRGAMQVKRIP
jgi:RES domain-containing protein